MAVYTDGVHLIGDSVDELHRFAESIGLKRCWFEGTKKGHPHYDLNQQMKNKAIGAGAIQRTSREIVQHFKDRVLF